MTFELSDFEALLPRAVMWAREQENLILERGVPLDAWEEQVARRLGVLHPDKVRLLQVAQVPMPEEADLRAAASAAGLVAGDSAGMALRYGIFIREDFWREREIVAHELVHTAQCERLGWEPFLRQYLTECLLSGYSQAPLEQEARDKGRQIMQEMGKD
ncbi:MAG TPA: hypothetical protein VGB77_10435 [Abditibacteriaceae bacterium]|jgi:hypothetical protein